MDAPGTVFYLVPKNKYATEIVQDPANRERTCYVSYPDIDPDKLIMRIGLDQKLKNPPYLASFGRRDHNDVILGKRFSRNDQCYFNFHKETGELLLHDISEKKDTELYDIDYIMDENGKQKEKTGAHQIWKTPRQCVVVLSPDLYRDPNDSRGLDRKWIFEMHDAVFHLVPRRTQGLDEARFTEERLAFAGQPDPDQTYEGTMQRLITLGLQSLKSEALTTTKPPSTAIFNPHNTRLFTPHQPEESEVKRYTKLRPLGGGGQGEVHKVVDMYYGKHYACKIIAVKREVPQWGISSEREFRARVEMEVNLVKQVEHNNIVPYIHTQGFKISQNIEIFMPVYEGSLQNLLEKLRHQKLEAEAEAEAVWATTHRMLYQILDALDYVHTHDPQIIHRDIKPANILYQGDNFLLTDFGIAKVVDASRTMIGTEWYMAPEVRQNGEQTPKVDIYGLGATAVECFVKLPAEEERRAIQYWRQWHEYLQTELSQHAPHIAQMLEEVPSQRPTARELLDAFVNQPIHVPLQSNVTRTSFRVSSLMNQTNGATMIYSAAPTSMDWTRTVATAFFQANSRSIPSLRPNPVAVRSPKSSPNRPAQPRIRRKGSVKSAKSANGRQKKGYKLGGSSENGHYTPSQSGVPKRSSGRRQHSRSKSILKAQEIQALGIA